MIIEAPLLEGKMFAYDVVLQSSSDISARAYNIAYLKAAFRERYYHDGMFKVPRTITWLDAHAAIVRFSLSPLPEGGADAIIYERLAYALIPQIFFFGPINHIGDGPLLPETLILENRRIRGAFRQRIHDMVAELGDNDDDDLPKLAAYKRIVEVILNLLLEKEIIIIPSSHQKILDKVMPQIQSLQRDIKQLIELDMELHNKDVYMPIFFPSSS
jgi:hypothetical protein